MRIRYAEKYLLVYWLKNQSRILSEAQIFATNDIDEFKRAIETANRCGYEIEYSTPMK